MFRDIKSAAREAVIPTAVWFWAVLLVLVTAAIVYTALPFFVEREGQVYRAANSYVISKQQELLMLRQQYEDLAARASQSDGETASLLRGQQRAILDRMRSEAALIPGDVPSGVAALLTGGR